MADVKLSKWDFHFYCRLLQKISVVYSEFRNDTGNILCNVLNSRHLKPIILKLSFMFIEFRYNLSFRVSGYVAVGSKQEYPLTKFPINYH